MFGQSRANFFTYTLSSAGAIVDELTAMVVISGIVVDELTAMVVALTTIVVIFGMIIRIPLKCRNAPFG